MKVLIVEDNPVNAEMMRLSLEREQYEAIMAGDGEEAFAKLEEHPDVDLVLTDVMMPNVGGLELLDRIRRRPEWKTLPVVVATSVANQATVRQAVSLHCKHFIVKPFTVQLLLQTVREAAAQRGVVLEDQPRVLGRLGLDAEGYERLAVTFARVVHERVQALRALCEAGEHSEPDPAMRRDLCALEESAGLLGAERVANLIASLGIVDGTLAADARPGAYKALLAELELLGARLPKPPKQRRKLVEGNPLSDEGGAEEDGADEAEADQTAPPESTLTTRSE